MLSIYRLTLLPFSTHSNIPFSIFRDRYFCCVCRSIISGITISNIHDNFCRQSPLLTRVIVVVTRKELNAPFYYYLTSRSPLSPFATFRSQSFLISTVVYDLVIVRYLRVVSGVNDVLIATVVRRRRLSYICTFCWPPILVPKHSFGYNILCLALMFYTIPRLHNLYVIVSRLICIRAQSPFDISQRKSHFPVQPFRSSDSISKSWVSLSIVQIISKYFLFFSQLCLLLLNSLIIHLFHTSSRITSKYIFINCVCFKIFYN